MNGLLVIDKPGGMTSRDVVNRVQRWFPRRTKIGHTGTLDPLATGVLVVCIGAATRLADIVQAMSKTYRSTFRLGATSTTDDADGDVTANEAAPPPRERIADALAPFRGFVEQRPPAFSALKVAGRRAHDLARSGTDVMLAPRTVRIDAVRALNYEWPLLEVEIDCGKGTYIRSIARDLGAALGCGGMVQTLRRTRIGSFRAEDGVGVEGVPADLNARLLPMSRAVSELPQLQIEDDDAARFRTGQALMIPNGFSRESHDAGAIAVLDRAGELIGLGQRHGRMLHPSCVLHREA